MIKAKIFRHGGSQAVRLPKEFRFAGGEVSVRREGEAVVLEPLPGRAWPKGFFKKIRIDDPTFGRPHQGETPPVREL